MTGTHPFHQMAPLDYRYALDAAMPVLSRYPGPAVRCNLAALQGEMRQRLSSWSEQPSEQAALWVEPLADSWLDELYALTGVLEAGAPLLIIASLPLARLLPERASWKEKPLCMSNGGLRHLRQILAHERCKIQDVYGIHSLAAIGYSLLGQQCERLGRPALGDRLHFASRLRYCVRGPLAPFSTVILIISTKY